MEGPVKDAVQPRLIAMDQRQLRRGGERFVRGSQPHELAALRLLAHALVDERFLDGHAATLAPAGGDHLLDQGSFDGIARGQSVDVLRDQEVEDRARFMLQHQDIGKHAVAQSVEGGPAFPLGGFRPFGAGAVSPRRLNTSNGTHILIL